LTALQLSSKGWKETKTIFDSFFYMVSMRENSLIKFSSFYSKLFYKNKIDFKFHFFLFQRWLLAANRCKKGIFDDLLKTEVVNNIQHFLDLYPNIDIKNIIFMIDKLINGIKENLNITLLITDFIIQLKKELNHGK
tara:strand:+ start:122 stop:529 length:408 start_codon:yes stop_codon:yes gene_type:complete